MVSKLNNKLRFADDLVTKYELMETYAENHKL